MTDVLRRALAIAAGLTVLLAAHAEAVTYYVSQSGSDANSCATATSTTQSQQKLTVAAGVACATAGDTVSIHGGTYTGAGATIDSQGHTVNSGTSWANAITIQAFPGDTTILQPPYNVSAVRIYGTATTYIVIQNLTMDMRNSTAGAGAEGVIIGGGPPYPGHIRLTGNIIKDGDSFGIHTGFGISDIQVIYNTISGFGSTSSIAGDAHGLYLSSSDGIFDGNDIFNNAGYGIHLWCSDAPDTHFCPGNVDPSRNIVRNNSVHDNGIGLGTNYGIVVTWGIDNQVYNNLIYRNKAGAQLYTQSTNTLFVNNTIYGNTNEAVAMQYYGPGTIIRNNIIFGNGQQPAPNGVVDYSLSGYTADHNIITNPTFTNAAAGDFTLQAGSNARDTGTNTGLIATAVLTDWLGTARPQNGTYDIGAWEYLSGISVTTATLPNGVLTVPYSRTLAAAGGTAPYTWAVISGALPTGLSLASGTGIISGTPGSAASSSFVIRATDAAAATATASYTVIMRAAATITTTSPLLPATSLAYTTTLLGAGDEVPYAWTVTSGALPAGFFLNPVTGTISGISGQFGTTTFTVRLTGSLGSSVLQVFSLTIGAEYRPPNRPVSRNSAEGFFFRRATPPVNPADRVMRGDAWMDISQSPPTLYVCTSASATVAVWALVP